MELSGLNLWLLAGGGALLLLVLMLRFAVRPRKKVVMKPGLGLDAGPNSLWGKPHGPGTAAAAGGKGGAGTAAVSPSAPLSGRSEEKPRDSYEETPRASYEEAPRTLNTPAVAGMPFVAPGAEAPIATASARPAERQGDRGAGAGVCPKCGGRFLHGEMEGPTLMIDGVAREDFQPLLSARECTDCGYLEFYTRAARS